MLGHSSRAVLSTAMQRYSQGDEEAYVALYAGLRQKLYRYLLRKTGSTWYAEELTQQTLLNLHQARARYQPGADVMPWVFAIATRCLIDHIRLRRREHRSSTYLVVNTPDLADTHDLLHSKLALESVQETLGQLTEPQRQVFELLAQNGMTLKEAAKALGITVGAVKARAHRLYKVLRSSVPEASTDEAALSVGPATERASKRWGTPSSAILVRGRESAQQ